MRSAKNFKTGHWLYNRFQYSFSLSLFMNNIWYNQLMLELYDVYLCYTAIFRLIIPIFQYYYILEIKEQHFQPLWNWGEMQVMFLFRIFSYINGCSVWVHPGCWGESVLLFFSLTLEDEMTGVDISVSGTVHLKVLNEDSLLIFEEQTDSCSQTKTTVWHLPVKTFFFSDLRCVFQK